MSVLIKGMEMPKSLGVCVTIYPDGRVVNFHGSGPVEVVGAAVRVPPHGDLIERDKLREKEFINDGDAYAVVMSRDIRNAPTIIPAEEGE